jgi:hypothetical protein
VYAGQIEEQMKDVYVTDHKRKAQKLLTFTEEEDEQFFKYHQSLNSYKEKVRIASKPALKFEKGSLQQRIFDPLAGATRNAQGTLVYEMVDRDFSH